MSLESLNQKIQERQKKASPRARARVPAKPAAETAVLVKTKGAGKAVASLLAAITDDDVELVAKVWREAMTATRHFWRESGRDERGKSIGSWVEEPDHRTRIDASRLVAAYREGLPIQRQLQLQGKIEDLDDMLNRVRSSPEAMKALEALTHVEPDVIRDLENGDVHEIG